MSRPPRRIVPAVGGNTPAIRLNSVLLPAPFGPMMPSTSPGRTASERSSITRSLPKLRLSPATSNSTWLAAVGHRFGMATERDFGHAGVVHDHQFQRPFRPLAPLAGNDRGRRGIRERSFAEVDRPDD